MNLLNEPVGKQDQYIAAVGGLTCFEIDKSGAVTVSPLAITSGSMHDLEDHLLLFFTGYSRNASALLADQKSKSQISDGDMTRDLHFVVELGLEIKGIDRW